MARPLRMEFAGAVYHVMARGNQSRPIYADGLDRQVWIDTLGAGRAASYRGAAQQAHGEAETERFLAQGLRALALETAALPGLPKSTPEKPTLAWWLCQQTTIRRRWVSERLAMGDESRVTQAIRRVKANRDQDLFRCQHQLTQILNADEGFTNEKQSLFRDCPL